MDQAKLQEMLDADQADCHAMRATPGVAPKETLTTAIGKAVAAGRHTIRDILAAAGAGYLTGGLQGAITAVLALLTS